MQLLEDLFLLGHQHARKNLLVANCIFLEAIRHYVIDILNEYDIGILLVEVLYQCAVSAGTEEQLAICCAEWSAVRISCERVCRWHLFRERNLILHAVFFLELLQVFCDMLTEERQVLVTHREVNIRCACECSFCQMLQRWSTCTVTVFMEQQQAFRQLAIRHIF